MWALWMSDRGTPDTEEPLVLVIDPTCHRDAWVALVVSVVYRQHALPMSWHVVEAQVRELWGAHFCRRRTSCAIRVWGPHIW